ncbi:hypothetical protein A9978_18845 [Pseudomonas sp. UMC65]|uniref:hypothetical protein n=1 Tax=Pseudomonas sp. UMC65 TaxID=1862323 RepID=UPI001603ECAD|nr:hypothetical protein [Pseudomonas sp. UMC65]MBB1614498.1 hypothetical protein [Pseudomonas sp. UMC65]
MSTSIFEASDEVVNETAEACARKLERWYGGLNEAIAALEASPADLVDLADLALREHIKDLRSLALKIHMYPRVVDLLILSQMPFPSPESWSNSHEQ